MTITKQPLANHDSLQRNWHFRCY